MLPILQIVIRLYEKMGYNKFKEENITDELTFSIWKRWANLYSIYQDKI